MPHQRRKRFLIDKPLQLRYMGYITAVLFFIFVATAASFYFGIWGGVLEKFSDKDIQKSFVDSTKDAQAVGEEVSKTMKGLPVFDQTTKLSDEQQKIFKEILDETNKRMVPKILLLILLIAWGTLYLSHKIAGPIYRISEALVKLKKGNLKTRITFREDDEAQMLASQFNEALVTLDQTLGQVKTTLQDKTLSSEVLRKKLSKDLEKIKTS